MTSPRLSKVYLAFLRHENKQGHAFTSPFRLEQATEPHELLSHLTTQSTAYALMET